MDSFDFVIVGADSAGCVLADRLSADPKTRVCLIEAGGSDRRLIVQMPSAISMWAACYLQRQWHEESALRDIHRGGCASRLPEVG